jgi:hypothetical protein
LSETLTIIRRLIDEDRVRVSDHAYDELVVDNLYVDEILRGVEQAVLVEDYPDAFKGPSCLVLQDHFGVLIHVVWGLPKIGDLVAVMITAYLPSHVKWYDGFTKRRPK